MSAPVECKGNFLTFGWVGPSSWRGGCSQGGIDVAGVDLIFKDARRTEISVSIPNNISPTIVQKLPFICRKYPEGTGELADRKLISQAKVTRTNSLNVTSEQIRTLKIVVGTLEQSSPEGPLIMHSTGKGTQEKHVRRKDSEVELEVPAELEIGQTYRIVMTSNNFLFSACLSKEEKAKKTVNEEPSQKEYQSRLAKMGEALIQEGVQNFNIALTGGGGVFDSSTSTADIFAHGIQGVFRAGQHVNQDIKVPYSKPTESASDLDKLSKDELQALFEKVYEKDKNYEIQRMRASAACNINELNQVIEEEHKNSQLLVMVSEALNRKGFKAQTPQSESFQAAATQSLEMHVKALQETCKMQ